MKPTVGSLFAGIGGIDLGFERAGFETVWQVEINEYCQKVLAKNFPKAERYADIRECGSHNLRPVDVVVGGFPCQDISNAGKRAGIEGERSGLWSEYARIICELRPSYVLVENVAALLGRGMGRVLGDLAAIGYDAEWEIISAADVGAPHLRERVWIVAYPYDAATTRQREDGGKVYTQSKAIRPFSGSSNVPNSDISGLSLRNEAGNRTEAMEGESSRSKPIGVSTATRSQQWAIEPNVGRVAHGVPSRVDRLRGLGNAVVPEIPYQIALGIRSALEAA